MTQPDESPLHGLIAAAIRPLLPEDLAPNVAAITAREITDAVLDVVLPTTRLLGELHRSAHEDVQRVIALYERWVKAGPPPLGTPVSRWWDARLVELHEAILPPTDQIKEQ